MSFEYRTLSSSSKLFSSSVASAARLSTRPDPASMATVYYVTISYYDVTIELMN